MTLGLGGPLAAFQMGQTAGEASSPVSGLGEAIRNILDTARKGGLLQTQSAAQSAGANQNAIASEQRAAAAGELGTRTIFAGADGQREYVTHQASEDVKALPVPQSNVWDDLEKFRIAQEKAAREKAAQENSATGVNTTTTGQTNDVVPFNSMAELEEAESYLPPGTRFSVNTPQGIRTGTIQ